MDFDSVSLQKAGGGSVLITAEKFMEMPIDDRINLIVAGKVEFINDGKIVSRDEILKHLEETKETGSYSGSYLMVMNGSEATSKRLRLTSNTTTLGKTGVKTGVITRMPEGYLLKGIEGMPGLLRNGRSIPAAGVILKNGDIVEVNGTRLQFFA